MKNKSAIKSLVILFTESPKKLFLVDSIGALVTAFFLYVVLRSLQPYIGMPEQIIINLAAIALCFFIYSAFCYFFLQKNHALFLRIISAANLGYCILTFVLVLIHFNQLTPLGLFYFLAEIIVIFCLVFVELNVARKLKLK